MLHSKISETIFLCYRDWRNVIDATKSPSRFPRTLCTSYGYGCDPDLNERESEEEQNQPRKKKEILTVQTRSALALDARWAIIQGYNRDTYHVLLLQLAMVAQSRLTASQLGNDAWPPKRPPNPYHYTKDNPFRGVGGLTHDIIFQE